jgi:hypothetical protein
MPAVVAAWGSWVIRMAAMLLVTLFFAGGSVAYSVLTHEEIVDLVWTDHLRPLLLKRFPALTEDQLQEAHGYAYGGAVIQDLGYYPFGSVEFSDLAGWGKKRAEPAISWSGLSHSGVFEHLRRDFSC